MGLFDLFKESGGPVGRAVPANRLGEIRVTDLHTAANGVVTEGVNSGRECGVAHHQ